MASKSAQNFCLQWKDFESNISSGFRELREDKEFFDVTLACHDYQVQAHKVILSACSPFFRAVLKKNPHPNPLIYLKGIKDKEIEAVLKFMYHGEVIVAQDDLNTFLAVAEDLEVKGLTETPQKLQPASQYQPAAKISAGTGYARTDQATQHSTATEYGTQQRHERQDGIDQASQNTQRVHEKDIEYIDPYLLPVMKTESAVVDVESDSEYGTEQSVVQCKSDSEYGTKPLVQHDSDYPTEKGGYDYQQGYQNINTGYEKYVGDTSQDFYSQHTRKASHGEYLCNLCGKQARDMYAMKKHLEGKHEITPGYNCPICNMFCKTKSILFKHKKNYH